MLDGKTTARSEMHKIFSYKCAIQYQNITDIFLGLITDDFEIEKYKNVNN
jgi:hypothetical protein